jgi:hypothetical protein
MKIMSEKFDVRLTPGSFHHFGCRAAAWATISKIRKMEP